MGEATYNCTQFTITQTQDIPDSESMNRMYCRGAEAAIVCYGKYMAEHC